MAMKEVIEWISQNKEFVFSGAGNYKIVCISDSKRKVIKAKLINALYKGISKDSEKNLICYYNSAGNRFC